MNVKIIFVIIISSLLGATASFFAGKYNSPKIAYVRSNDLIYAYEGTKEAQTKYTQQKERLQANADTLKLGFQKAIASYNENYSKMNITERAEQEQRLSSQESQLQQYIQAIEEKSATQDDEMMQSVLNQINSFAKDYGEEHGYDVILGTTSSGNVLYGKKDLDITEELLKALNQQYRGE